MDHPVLSTLWDYILSPQIPTPGNLGQLSGPPCNGFTPWLWFGSPREHCRKVKTWFRYPWYHERDMQSPVARIPAWASFFREHRQEPFWLWPQQLLARHLSKCKETKAKMNYWDFIKVKSLCTARERLNKTKSQPTEWEKILIDDILGKGLVSKLYKELTKLTPKNREFSQ